MPSGRAPSNALPTYVARRSTADCKVSAGAETGVGRNEVVPCRASVLQMTLMESFVASMTSTPPQPWTCGSMKPGTSVRFDASIRTAPSGTRTSETAPAASMRSPRTTTRTGENFSNGVRRVPASRTSGASLTTGAQMPENLPEVAVAFRQTLLRDLAGTAQCAHQHRHLQFAAGSFGQLVGFLETDAEDFPQHMHPTRAQFRVGHCEVDHPVAVRH